ncbi:hypothetical protein LTR95_004893 [Oleoguttula sp. CCFEE 5521]
MNLPLASTLNASIASSRLFTKLSGELRNIIWKFALIQANEIHFTNHGFQEPGLLTTCRLVRAEAASTFYHEYKIHLICESYDTTAVLLLERKFKLVGLLIEQSASDGRVLLKMTGGPYWQNWLLWLRRVHSLTTGCSPGEIGNDDFESMALRAISLTVTAMCTKRWSKVEEILKLHRPMLIKCNSAWGLDHDQDG